MAIGFISLVIIIYLILMLLFERTSSDNTQSEENYFISVGYIGDDEFFYDKYTKIMYVKRDFHNNTGMAVLYNSNKTPMSYDEWCNLEESEE